MGVKKAIVKLSSLAENESLRICYTKEQPKVKFPLVKLINCLEIFESGNRPKGGIVYMEEDEDSALSLGGEQINVDGSVDLTKMPLIPLDFYENSNKGKVLLNDILICKDGALTGKSCFVSNAFPIDKVMVNEHVYIFRGNGYIHQKILFYIIRSSFVQFQIKDLAYRKKGQPGLNSDHIMKIRIPDLNLNLQNKLLKKIESIELLIEQFKKGKCQIEQIINNIIGKELGFDWAEFEMLKSKSRFNASLMDFSNNIDCRFSYKFHNEAGQYIYDFLCSKTSKRVKDFISEPILLGKSISPKDYDEKGEYYYISMADIKLWKFDTENCNKVTREYSFSNLTKTVQKNDVILARSGEGTIGKVALIRDEEIKAVFSDFTQRIRLKNYNPKLAYYYFRSEFIQYLVYVHKKGLGNNTNIFPSQIQEFPIPNWSEGKQAEILEKIKLQIEAQSELDRKVEESQNEITKLIENTIMMK
jgi:hypothetical protein